MEHFQSTHIHAQKHTDTQTLVSPPISRNNADWCVAYRFVLLTTQPKPAAIDYIYKYLLKVRLLRRAQFFPPGHAVIPRPDGTVTIPQLFARHLALPEKPLVRPPLRAIVFCAGITGQRISTAPQSCGDSWVQVLAGASWERLSPDG